MASPSSRPPLPLAGCPQVAELIDYAWNRLSGDERRRIDRHLQQSACQQCQGWIEQARKQTVPPLPAAARSADSSQWHRQAFADLENRLRALEE